MTVVDMGLVGRPDGDGDEETLMLPENPLRLRNAMLLCPELPWGMVWETVFVEIVKSAKVIVAVYASWSTHPHVWSTVSQALRLSVQIG